ncbi:PAS domain-containing protein [Desertibaculum subflavum]|uniref:PAS domain-containing protein n=1 Tax=Desertibaculum subflavum TaxID=2268458 RepID=UPI000E65F63E
MVAIQKPPIGTLALPDDLRSPDSAVFIQAWNRWRGDRVLPSRSDFDLGSIKRLLPRVILLEIRSPTEATFRLAGTWITRVLGIELTGRNYLELGDPADRQERAALLFAEVAQPCGAVMIYPMQYASGRAAPVEVISVPVVGDAPSGPPLVFALLTELAPTGFAEPLAAEVARQLPTGRQLRFFDIGAGTPDIPPYSPRSVD